jgi:hypothetical protein
MHVPGVTTTRLYLALAAVCALSGDVPGIVTGLLILGVVAARLLAIRHDSLRADVPVATSLASRVPSLPTAAPGTSAA